MAHTNTKTYTGFSPKLPIFTIKPLCFIESILLLQVFAIGLFKFENFERIMHIIM